MSKDNPMSKEEYERQKVRIALDERYPPALKEWMLAKLDELYQESHADESIQDNDDTQEGG